MKRLLQIIKSNAPFPQFYFTYLTYLLIFILLDPTKASKFNPTVKVRTQEIEPDHPSVPESKTTGPGGSAESPVSKSKNCAAVNCMPKPVPAPGSPECRPRFDADSCCPTWICASDEILANSLFDKDNNWNVKHEYDHDMFDFDDDHHDDFPPREKPKVTITKTPVDDKEKFDGYVKKGKLDNTHNKNFIKRMEHEEASKSPASPQSEPSIANNYAEFKRNLNSMNSRHHHNQHNII